MKHAAKTIYTYKSIGMHANAHLPSYPQNADPNKDTGLSTRNHCPGEII